MKDFLKESNKQKHLFKVKEYCPNCQQKKGCGLLDEEKNYCCACYRKILEELEKDELLVEEAQMALDDYRKGVIKCKCLESEKTRIKYLKSDGSGWSRCQICEKSIAGAGHHRVIKNRNDPKFWGLEVKEKVLCLKCLEKFQEQMPQRKQYLLAEYQKRYVKNK